MPQALDPIMALLGVLLGRPMNAHQLLPGLYDPTGLGFEHAGGGLSSELNIITGEDGRYQMIPTLVPGQVGIESILRGGQKLTPEQFRIALDYARSRRSEVPTFKTVKEAEDYENLRHEGLNRGDMPSDPRDFLSALILSLPGSNR